MHNDYIGRKFKGRDGNECTIIEQLTFDKKPSHCRYKVRYKDGVVRNFSYITLRQGDFNKVQPKTIQIGDVLKSKDGFECKVLGVVEVKNTVRDSQSKYRIRFNDGFEKVLCLKSLSDGNFVKYNLKDYIGQEYISRDGYKCRVISIVDANVLASKAYYNVEFEDGLKAQYNISTLLGCKFTHDTLVDPILNKEFVSNDGYKFRVIERITFEKNHSRSKYRIRFDDGYENILSYHMLMYEGTKRFSNHTKDYIGTKYMSKDGYECEIIKRLTFDKEAWNSKFLVRFEDGTEQERTLYPILRGNFNKIIPKTGSHIGEEYISKEGMSFKVVEQVTDNLGCYSKNYFMIEFEDGFKWVMQYGNIKDGVSRYRTNSSNLIIVSKEDIIQGYHLCNCRICNSKHIMTNDEIAEHLKSYYRGKSDE